MENREGLIVRDVVKNPLQLTLREICAIWT